MLSAQPAPRGPLKVVAEPWVSSRTQKHQGSPDKDLLESGILGRGIVVSAPRTNVAMGPDGFERPVVAFSVEVALDNQDRYLAECRQATPVEILAQIVPGSSTGGARVDPTNRSNAAIDWDTEPPTVTVKQGRVQECR